MVEAVTVRRDRIRPVPGISPTLSTSKFFDIKILPASDCAPWFTFHFHANPMIPIDPGGEGGTPSHARAAQFREPRRKLYLAKKSTGCDSLGTGRGKKMDQRTSDSARSKADEAHAERTVEECQRLSSQGDSAGWKFDREEIHERK